jgi:indolepyruvate ferredoxin oxidoreductase alpha subunit
MGERSFAEDVKQLGYGAGDLLHGEGILAITKALLQSGVSYVGGYPGAPVSYLIDVLADANEPLLKPLGIYFEQSGSEAAAAALLGASINYPMRGAVTWKSVVGTNVASDALSHVASAGVIGGSVIVIGEDYGEGASILQERTHSTALKSSIPLLDPATASTPSPDSSRKASASPRRATSRSSSRSASAPATCAGHSDAATTCARRSACGRR